MDYRSDPINPGGLPSSSRTPRSSRGSLLTVVVCVLFAAAGPITFGYSLGYTSPTKDAIVERFNMSKSDWSLFSSLLPVGAMVGSVFVGAPLLNAVGRRVTAILCAVPFIGGYLLLSLGRSIGLLIASRFVIGLATGMVSLTVPVYIAEIAPAAQRGMFGSFNQLGVTAGVLLVYGLGLTDLSWKVLGLLGIVAPSILAIGLLFMPESPAWLMSHRSPAKAEAALQRLRGRHADIDDELLELQDAQDMEKKRSFQSFSGKSGRSGESAPLMGSRYGGGYRDSDSDGFLSRMRASFSKLCRRSAMWPLVISIAMMVAQQMGGVNAVTMFAGSIFADANFDNVNLAALYVALVQFLSTGLSCWMVDRLGRRILLSVSAAGLGISCTLLGGFFYVRESAGVHDDVPLGWLALASLLAYIFFFSIGMGPIPWLLMSEILPSDIRSTLSSISTLANWGLVFLVTQTYQSLVDAIGQSYTFWFYGCWNVASFLFVLIFVPETKGKSLMEIEQHFKS